MFPNGKIIGLFLGLFLGGFIGMIIGLVIGHLYDQGWFHALFGKISGRESESRTDSPQTLLFAATFMTMGYIAKADGRVSEKEIAMAKHIMGQLQLSEYDKREAMRLFYRGKDSRAETFQNIALLKQVYWQQPQFLYRFFNMQIQMASAEGYIHPSQKRILETIANQLGISSPFFSSSGSNHSHSTATHRNSLEHYYQILNVSPQATDAEIRKAYRKLISQYHPDKLIAKKRPAEEIQQATEKTQQIQEAYDKIRKTRGYS